MGDSDDLAENKLSDVSRNYSFVARSSKRLTLVCASILPLLLVYIYLVLVQRRVDTVGASSWMAPLHTEMAFFVYGVLLAGTTGSLLRQIALRPQHVSGVDGEGESVAASASFLFVGAMAAFAVAVLLPTALLVPSAPEPNTRGGPGGLPDPFAALNKFGLIVLATWVGYASREALSGVAASVRDLLEAGPWRSTADIEDRVEATLKRVIAPAPLINFSGTLAVGIDSEDGHSKLDNGTAYLESDKPYKLAVFLASGPNDTPPSGMVAKPLSIKDGVDAGEVMFDLLIDGSVLGVPILRRTVTLGSTSGSVLVHFDITPRRLQSPSNKAAIPGAAEGVDLPTVVPSIQVSLYQGALPCGELHLPATIWVASAGP